MRRIEQLSIIIIITWTLGALACDGGNGGSGGGDVIEPGVDAAGDVLADVPPDDALEEDLAEGDLPAPDVLEDLPYDFMEDEWQDYCGGDWFEDFKEDETETPECVDDSACHGAEVCVAEDGTCACLPPNWTEGDACTGPALTATLEDVDLGEAGKWIGADEAGAVRSGNALFHNNYDPEWMSWDGFAVSSHTDTETPGFMNDLSAITGGGAYGSAAYAVGYASGFAPAPPALEILDAGDAGVVLKGLFITNTTYAYLSMLNGDDFSKKFGGEDGADEDWFMLTIHGLGPGGGETGTVDFYLADFRAAEPAGDYIVDQWTWVDLTSLGPVTGLGFTLASTDTGDWGINTPAYFALDDLNRVEPVAAFHDLGLPAEAAWDGADGTGAFQSGNLRFPNNYNADWMSWDGFAASTMTDVETPGMANMFSAYPGAGDGDAAYAVAYDGSAYGSPAPFIEVVGGPAVFESMSLTNTTWAYLSMLNGDDFAKKFGGEDGADEDWFLLTVEGLDAGGAVAGTLEHYLADFRFEGAGGDDYLLSTWEAVDLTSLGAVSGLRLSLSSSDTGEWGMNTPAYVALDSVILQD